MEPITSDLVTVATLEAFNSPATRELISPATPSLQYASWGPLPAGYAMLVAASTEAPSARLQITNKSTETVRVTVLVQITVLESTDDALTAVRALSVANAPMQLPPNVTSKAPSHTGKHTHAPTRRLNMRIPWTGECFVFQFFLHMHVRVLTLHSFSLSISSLHSDPHLFSVRSGF